MTWLLRIILILVILRILWRMIMGPMRRPRNERKNGRASVPLVRDPVCGTYLLPDRAVKVGTGEGILYFCSETCRARYHDTPS